MTTNEQQFDAVQGVDLQALTARVEAGFAQTLAELKELVAIPGIAWDSFDAAQLDRSAEAVAELVRDSGMDDVRILRVDTPAGVPGGPPS